MRHDTSVKVRGSASHCYVQIVIILTDDEIAKLIGERETPPLVAPLKETRGFHTLFRVDNTNRVAIRYQSPVHPLNLSSELLTSTGEEIFAAVEAAAREIMET